MEFCSMKVSIIIPIYNVEKYLPRCIKSVLEQTYKELEIILVDDGTKDNSGVMCDEYAKQDERIHVIHKKNGGLSSARNAGIEVATGDAIFFLDSDDYIPHDCIQTCVEVMNRYEADEVIMKDMYISEEINEELEGDDEYFEVQMNSEEAIEQSLYQYFFTVCASTRLFKRNVIGNIRFPVGKLAEDLATCHLFFDNANKIVYVNKIGSYYRQQSESIMHVFNIRRLDALVWAKEIELFCQKKYPKISKAAICRTFNVAVHLALDIPDNYGHIEINNQIWAEIKRTRLSVIFNRKARKRDRVAALLSYFGEIMLKRIWNSRLAVKQKVYS